MPRILFIVTPSANHSPKGYLYKKGSETCQPSKYR
jgi:hypothetical protein